ncbi:unnamed protein product [Spirodela intermedia]|uniref:Uncharacterized protein n=1 Tax=Spirodela intermedia TaxID=51605 RepID=A0A7I8JEM3_SPIIN|nr:unnamed protein product [Spirodela intermedia]CAA6668569.1 unnamed protein product [Spirodela intermedia]
MASSWKKTKLGGISRVLASKVRLGVGDSPLVVKAGFPTSVADLVVKSRARLRRPPRWMRRKVAVDGEVGGFVMAEASVASSPSGPGGSAEAVEQKRSKVGVSDGGARSPSASGESPEVEPPAAPIGAFRSVSGSEAPRNVIREDVPRLRSRFSVSVELRDEVPQATLRKRVPEEEGPGSSPLEAEWKPEGSAFVASAERKFRDGGSGRGLEMAAKIGFSLLILALGTKKIAIGVSISAFIVLVLESLGRRLIPLLRSRGDLKKKHSSPGGGPAFEILRSAGVSDLSGNRRIPAENLTVSSEFDSALIPLPAIEAEDRLQANGIPEQQKPDNANRKARKLLRKLVPKKLRVAKSEMEGKLGTKANAASDSSSRGASGQKAIEGKILEEKEEEEDEEEADVGVGSEDEEGEIVPCSGVSPEADDAAFPSEMAVPLTNQSLRHHVLLLIVLFGLVGGRFAAMVITVALYSLATWARRLFKNRKMRQNQSA